MSLDPILPAAIAEATIDTNVGFACIAESAEVPMICAAVAIYPSTFAMVQVGE